VAHEAQEVLETTSTRRGSGVLDPRDELDEEAVHRGGRRDRLALFERQDPLKHVAQHGTAPARVADAPEPREKARIGDGRFEQALQQCLGAHGARNVERPGEEEVSPAPQRRWERPSVTKNVHRKGSRFGVSLPHRELFFRDDS
jgi:hypothetical protein